MKKIIVAFFILTLFVSNIICTEKSRVAVLDFSAKGVEKELVEAIVENLTTALIDSNSYTVIERSQLQKLMNEQSLQNSDDFNDDVREELGNLYGAQIVILGSVTMIGKTITINVRGVEVSTGVVQFGKSFRAVSEDEIPLLIRKLVYSITGNKGVLNSDVAVADIENEIKNERVVIDEAFYAPRLAMGINVGIWTPISILSLVGAVPCLGVYLASQNMDIIDTNMQNNLRTGAITLFTVGGVTLTLAIITGALYSFYDGKYRRVVSDLFQLKNENVELNFDVGFAENGVKLGMVLLL